VVEKGRKFAERRFVFGGVDDFGLFEEPGHDSLEVPFESLQATGVQQIEVDVDLDVVLSDLV